MLDTSCWKTSEVTLQAKTSTNNSHSGHPDSHMACKLISSLGSLSNCTSGKANIHMLHCVRCTNGRRDHTAYSAAGLLDLKSSQILTEPHPDQITSPQAHPKATQKGTARRVHEERSARASLLFTIHSRPQTQSSTGHMFRTQLICLTGQILYKTAVVKNACFSHVSMLFATPTPSNKTRQALSAPQLCTIPTSCKTNQQAACQANRAGVGKSSTYPC